PRPGARRGRRRWQGGRERRTGPSPPEAGEPTAARCGARLPARRSLLSREPPPARPRRGIRAAYRASACRPGRSPCVPPRPGLTGQGGAFGRVAGSRVGGLLLEGASLLAREAAAQQVDRAVGRDTVKPGREL